MSGASGKDMPGVRLDPAWASASRFRLLDCDKALVEALTTQPSDASAALPAAEPEGHRKRHRTEIHFKSDGAAAYITTNDGVHGIRRVEYSNSLLVVRDSTIVEKCKYVFECNKTRARTERATVLLRENYVSLDELERRTGPPAPAKLLSLAALRLLVPADNDALDKFLASRGAMLQGPFVRLVHPSLQAATLDAVMRVMEAAVVDLPDGIAVDVLEEALAGGVEAVLLRSCLEAHGDIGVKTRPQNDASDARSATPPQAQEAPSGEAAVVVDSLTDRGDRLWWTPDRRRIVARLADVLLKEQEDDWRVDAFFTALGQRYSLLAGLSADDVPGVAVLLEGKFLRRLPEDELPFDPLDRYKQLVTVKPRWTSAELEGYLGPLDVSGKALAAFVGKHCREHKDHAGKGVPTSYSLA